jgi:hypothetical protein
VTLPGQAQPGARPRRASASVSLFGECFPNGPRQDASAPEALVIAADRRRSVLVGPGQVEVFDTGGLALPLAFLA